MDLIVYAVPFFIAAMLLELAYGWRHGRNTYRLNDSVSSLFLGTLSQARRFVTLGVGGYVYHLLSLHFALPQLAAGHWFTWVFAFIAYDFCYYWLHRLGHERTLLWAAHVAHHQSEEYNLSTALRQTSTGFLLSWIFYIPLFLAGVPAEVVVTVGSLNLIYQFWVHTRHIGKLGWYEYLFVTPSNHRVHHAQNDVYVDRNYGGVFIIWDRLFGTFQEELAGQPCIYGIRGPLHSFNPLQALSHIYVDMLRDCWHTHSWRDKLRIWTSRTGWRPADVARQLPREKTDLAHFVTYNPQIPRAFGRYALAQLVAVVLLLAGMELAQPPYAAGVALWALMLATTATTALWLQAEPGLALRWDALRLVVALPVLLFVAAHSASAGIAVLLAGGLYLGGNAISLAVLRQQSLSAAEFAVS